jgi:hypothetical protein
MIWTLAFWRAVTERAIKSFAYSLTATLTGGVLNIAEVPWQSALLIAAGATLLSVLGSITSSGLTGGGPSLTNAEVLDPVPAPGVNERLARPSNGIR